MKYAFRAKIFLALVIAALVSASIAFLLDSPTLKRATAPTKEIKQEQAEVMIDGFRFAKTEEGKDNWELVAKKAEVEKDTGRAKLQDLEATFNAKGGMVMKLKADRGTFDSSTKAVSVGSTGNPVTVESSSGYKMSVRDMSWDDKRQELSTSKGVTLTGKNIKIEGKGMVARTDLQEIRITDGVKTTFSQ
jgi:LPS export ABC transporter protein LptC